MAEQPKNHKNLRLLSNYYFEITKKWWTYTWYLKFAVFVIGLTAVFFPNISVFVTILVGVLSFASEACNVCSNDNKGIAESLLRKLDLHDSLGWEITRIEIADAVVTLPTKIQEKFSLPEVPDDYFASSDIAGLRRATQNLQESSWWSKHLAMTMGKYCFRLTVVLIVTSILTLIVSSILISSTGQQAGSHVEQLTSINRLVIAILLLVVSFGLIPLTRNYFTFSKKAENSERLATNLLKSGINDDTQAIKALNEYHLARASAPLLPSWLWNRKKDALNKAWKEYVAEQI